jgi:8-oxo-dGTP pyrophosphatase MutT (NUDIX family)
LPGGDSEPEDLTPADTAKRELFEETGVTALELESFGQWFGERGQPVYGFFVSKWRGSRLRSSGEGKAFWASPESLLLKSAYYRVEAKHIFERLGIL